jgi:hypothetical protein
MPPFAASRASADSLRRPSRAVGCGNQLRADAAVARQGLRAAVGAWARVQVPGFKPGLSTGKWCAAPRVGALDAWRLPRSAPGPGPARYARP